MDSWVRKIPWRMDRLPTPVFFGFLCGSAGKESACNTGDLGSTPGLGKYSGEREGYPLQYSGLENSRDYIVHGATKNWTQLSNFHLHFHGDKNNSSLPERLVSKSGEISFKGFVLLKNVIGFFLLFYSLKFSYSIKVCRLFQIK